MSGKKPAVCLLLLLLLTISHTPEVEAGPVAVTACILAGCGTACASAAAVCKWEELFGAGHLDTQVSVFLERFIYFKHY